MSDLLTTPKALKQSALKIWQRGDIHRAWLQKTSCFPLDIPLKNIPAKNLLTDYSELQDAIYTLRQDSEKHGYLIIDKAISHRQLGEQKIPAVIRFTNAAIFLSYLAKTAEFIQFQALTEQSLQQDGLLIDWLIRYPFKVMQYAEVWPQLLKVCAYFEAHPQPGCYIRQLDIKGVDSKFIEQYKSILSELLTQTLAQSSYQADISGLKNNGFERRYGLRYDQPLIRLRILDPALAIQGLTDLTLTLSEFKALNIPAKTVFIAENKVTVLAFPDHPEAIVIFGLGYAVNLLADARCLQDRTVYYWGDLDADGLAILARLRQYYPQVKSMLMDAQTLEQFAHLVVHAPTKITEKILKHLSDEENLLYQHLHQECLRLEQERISFSYLQQYLNAGLK
ncbi:hypothetical protein AU255_17995 [Methyloprofundus sedimenti]|uniref:Wadjet protein JetD C-terminal domain-containing protein n=1 Tax=Methyloprofundus sedimenti TaxID=1420851 RepID=A0A1V8M1R4_9GAMM|nr:Wadjet anti-phage system protein JetD domain-containing protein [Methyloprofundus sedimenti]OQK15363.1 hypothetical protein AU255_17995 [Methyloprofundus sedimenti]